MIEDDSTRPFDSTRPAGPAPAHQALVGARGRGSRGARMTATITGIHHVTAIAGDPQRNLDFYTGTLGLRLVKLTVNFDDPATYHFYFGDEAGAPGTILTFFPWPKARRGSQGTGQVSATSFAVPRASLDFWRARLAGVHLPAEDAGERFGDFAIRVGIVAPTLQGNQFHDVPRLAHAS